MIRILEKMEGRLQNFCYVSCPFCYAELNYACVSPVYCIKCRKELPPYYLLHMCDYETERENRMEYHFTGVF